MDNKGLLAPHSLLNVDADWDTEQQRIAIVNNTETAGMVAAMRENVDKRKKALAVVVDENKLNSTKLLAENLVELDSILTDTKVLERVKASINTAKDYNEFAKASNEIYTRMMKQQLSTADPTEAKKQANIKVAVVTNAGTTMVSIGGDD